MVFYRTYRPQTIAELDSPTLRETLYAILASAKEGEKPNKNNVHAPLIPHAFLFTGPKGLGKTSTARIIAKILNCTGAKRDGIEPCNECDQCVSITNGNNIDVLEIDGASNRGIDEIRELKERINLAPSKAKKKVYIIDEVHMLTTEAFNALLKTIEEPPAHVVFIFATTEPQKVPATIVSRCFHISLRKATKEELTHALKRVLAGEKLTISDEALGLIAEMGDGGYRDATKILEELISVANGRKIDKGFIEEHYHITGVSQDVGDFLQALFVRNAVDALRKIAVVVEQGTSIKYFIEQVLSQLHLILLAQIGIGEKQTNLPQFDQGSITVLVTLFSQAYQETKYAVIQSLPLELAVVSWCQAGSSPVLQESVEHGEGEAKNVALRKNADKPTMQDVLKKEQNLKVKQVLAGATGKKPVEEKQAELTHTQDNLPKDIHAMQVFMENLIYKVKPYNHSVAGVLRGCVVTAMDENHVRFAAAYPFHKEKLEEPKTREILEKVVREITGKGLQVMVELKK